MGELITLEEGMSRLEEGIQKAKLILDGYSPNQLFTPEEYMKYYDCVYYMCIQQKPYEFSQQLLERYKKAMEESIFSKILPSLIGKSGNFLLMELLHMWMNYKAMVKCLGGFFLYIDRKRVYRKNTETLIAVSIRYFSNLVCEDFQKLFVDAALILISQERNEQLIDRDLLRGISNFFVEVGGLGEGSYYKKFENAVLEDTANYYSQLASQWLVCYSSADYLVKVEQCLFLEKERASHFMYPNSAENLLKVMHSQLISQPASKLIEKQKADNHDSTSYQELLSRCSRLSIG